MERPIFEVGARLNGVSTKVDGSLTMRFETAMEMKPDEVALLISYVKAEGYLLFAMNQFQESDIPKENMPEAGKSTSSRLRGVLYVYWKENINSGDFGVWYKKKMESIIESVKEKLPARNGF